MTSVYALHRDLSQPTAIEHTATAHFTSPDSVDLLLAKQHVLELYTLVSPSPSSPDSPHLHRIASFALFGAVQSLAIVRVPGFSRDSLLVAFAECKLSLLHFSPSTRDIVTLDTGFFEALKEQTTPSGHPQLTPTLPLLRVDPLNRCAVLLAYHHTLLVFPLHEHSAAQVEHGDFAVHPHVYAGPTGILRPYPIPFTHASFAPPRDPSAGLSDLVDFAFLSGYNSPTLLLLHRHPYTWEGRYAAHRHTSQLLTITLDLAASSFLVLARTALQLPYDTHALLPLPAPHGGCLVFSAHLLFHFSNQHIDYTLSTNVYGDHDTKYHSEQSGVVVNMQLAAASILSSTPALIQLLLALRDGQLLLMTIETAGTGVRAMQLRKLAVTAPSSAISTLQRRGSSLFVFVGSRVGASVLVEMRERSEDEMRAEVRELERQEDERMREREERERERQRLLRGGGEADGVEAVEPIKADAEEEFDDIFGMSLSSDREREAQRREERARAKEETSKQFELTVRDAMVGVAPCVDFVMRPGQGRHIELVGVSGQGQQGAISIQQVGAKEGVDGDCHAYLIHLLTVVSRTVWLSAGWRCAHGDHSIRSGSAVHVSVTPSASRSASAALPLLTLFSGLVLWRSGCWTVRAQERRVRRSQKRKREEAVPDSGPPEFDTDLFISGVSSTTHLHTAEEITQVDTAASYLRVDVRSVLIGNVCGWLGVVQVWPDGLRVVWRGEKTVERSVHQLAPQLHAVSPGLEDEGMGAADERKEANGSSVPLTIVRAKLCDPYLALGFSDGRLSVLRVDEEERKEEKSDDSEPFVLAVLPSSLAALPSASSTSSASPAVTAVSIFHDAAASGLFALPLAATSSMDDAVQRPIKSESGAVMMNEEKTGSAEEEVDELEMLLGGSAASAASKASAVKNGTDGLRTDVSLSRESAHDAAFVCVICRAHYLELYSLPSFTLLFRTPRFTSGRKTLTHSGEGDPAEPSHGVSDDDLPLITDVGLHTVSALPGAAPVLCAYTSQHDVLVYQPFAYAASTASHTALRFTRFQHGTLTRPLIARTGRQAVSPAVMAWLYGDRFVPFSSLSGHSCLLITGYRPLLLFGERGHLRLHDLSIDPSDGADDDKELEAQSPEPATSDERRERLRAGVACAVPFHNSQCERGCIVIDIAGVVHICELAPAAPLPAFSSSASGAAPVLLSRDAVGYTHYDHALPVRVHPLPSTPRFLCYHSTTDAYALVLSRLKLIQSMEEPTPRSITLSEESYELLLLSAPSSAAPFSIIGRFDDFDPHECVLCMTPVTLNDTMFIAIGTATQLGEETSVKGRILLLDAYAAASSTAATPLLKLRVFAQAEKGPVTAVAFVGNLLAVGVGMKVMLYEYDGKALVGRAFLDVQHYVVGVRVIKYYLLIADVFRTVLLAGWDPVTKQLLVLGRHTDGMELTAVDLLIDHRQLSLVAADMAGNLQLLRWQPKLLPPPPPPPAQINGGTTLPLGAFFAAVYSQRMAVKADFHTSSAVTRMDKFRLRVKEPKLSITQLNRAKSGTGGGGSGGVPGLLPEPVLTSRQVEQQQAQPFNLATHTPPLSTSSKLPALTTPIRSALLLSSTNGQYSVLQPLDELVYRRLHTLASQLHLHVPMYAALNARAFRSVALRGGRHAGRRNVVDGQLLRVFLGLTLEQQTSLGKTIGMPLDHIHDTLRQLEAQSALH